MYSATRAADAETITEVPGHIRAWCCTPTGPGLRLGYSTKGGLDPKSKVDEAQLMNFPLSPSSIGLRVNDHLLLEWTSDCK